MLPLFPVCLLFLPVTVADLRFVAVIWRHGDRAPSGLPYPLDRHNETAWPRGWSQLTNEGIQQAYDLGTWIRNRYMKDVKHIDKVFNKDEVLVKSSESERALASAQAVMASLFKPEGDSVWKSDFAWQPTPIHSTGELGNDPLLKPTSIDCPAYDKLMEKEIVPLYRSIDSANGPLFGQLSKYTGMNVTARNVDELDDINREMIHNLDQPDWVTDEVVSEITEFARQIHFNKFNTREKARYRGGYLVGDWHSRINSASKREKKAMKTILYSSHHGTLTGLLYTLGIGNDILIPYAAVVVAELHEENGSEFVKIWYRNETSPTTIPYLLTIPGCNSSCPLTDFNRIVAPLTINTTLQLEQMCSSVGTKTYMSIVMLIIIYLLAA